jgi:uncharacterized OsmC-like protein
MTGQKEIKNKFERNFKALKLKPTLGIGTGRSKTRIVDGLSCVSTEGNWELKTDMPVQAGGSGRAPAPGVLGRAALGSCLAIGYMLWASRLDVAIDSLEVDIEADYDDGALFGSSDAYPGYLEIRYKIRIESNAPRVQIEEVIDLGDKHSPYLDVFSRAQACKREIEIINH